MPPTNTPIPANAEEVVVITNLIEQAQARAEAEGLAIRFDEGDAEQLPYDDAAFDGPET